MIEQLTILQLFRLREKLMPTNGPETSSDLANGHNIPCRHS